MPDSNSVTVTIAPQFKGHITPRGLIEQRGTLEFRTNYKYFGEGNTGVFCRISSKDYVFEVGCTSSAIYFLRNSDRLEVPLNPVVSPTGNVVIVAMWDTSEVSLLILDDAVAQALSESTNEEDKVKVIEKRQIKLNTSPTLPPNSLLNWARQQAVLPANTYETVEQFNEVVASALESVVDVISSLGTINSFWDVTYDGASLLRRLPKREVDIHPIVHSLLFHLAIAKNLEVVPEYPIASGNLDFLISGHLTDGNTVSACIEFKHAHSDDLSHGLLKQLPTYMKAKGCDFGIYAVLYFRGSYFEEPEDLNITQLRINLEKEKREAGLRNIRILMFDLSRPISPSKL